MTGRVETDPNAIEVDWFAPFHRLVGMFAEAETEQRESEGMTEIGAAACAGVIAMGMGDDGLVHRSPWIDIKSALRAEETMVCEFDERHVGDYANNKPGGEMVG